MALLRFCRSTDKVRSFPGICIYTIVCSELVMQNGFEAFLCYVRYFLPEDFASDTLYWQLQARVEWRPVEGKGIWW